VRRHHAVWLVCLPLTAVGSYLTHVVACGFAQPSHIEGGHAHAGHTAECLAAGIAVLLVALVLGAAHALRRSRSSAPPLWLFPLLPPLGFAVQEQVTQPLLGGGSPGIGLALALGFALQVPIALAIYLIARSLLRIASSLVRALAGWRPRLVPLLPTRVPAVAGALRRPAPLALGYAERGPPALVR
jgi:hypothetical protein